MTPVLYFHGFASSPASAKITALRPLLAPYGIELNTPDLNIPSFEQLDFEAIVAHALAIARREPPRAMVGSSMGALIAIALAKSGVHAPLVLIAPALGVARRWKEKIPDGDPVIVYNYARAADAPIHRAFFEQMANLHIDDDPPPTRVTLMMGRQDETVPFDLVAETWERWRASGALAEGSKFMELAEGDHALIAHAEAIREAIVEAAA
jgi:predicted esterase YcpF (UPF0227 family)